MPGLPASSPEPPAGLGQQGADLSNPPRATQPVSLVAWRVLQFILDLAVVAVLCYAAASLMAILPKAPDGTYANPVLTLAMLGVVMLLSVGANLWYWVQWPLAHDGQTLAMRALRLRVVALDGSPASHSQLALRMVLLVADAMFLGLVGVLAMLSSPLRQRLGDLVASTLVVPVPREGRRGREKGRRTPASPPIAAPDAASTRDDSSAPAIDLH